MKHILLVITVAFLSFGLAGCTSTSTIVEPVRSNTPWTNALYWFTSALVDSIGWIYSKSPQMHALKV